MLRYSSFSMSTLVHRIFLASFSIFFTLHCMLLFLWTFLNSFLPPPTAPPPPLSIFLLCFFSSFKQRMFKYIILFFFFWQLICLDPSPLVHVIAMAKSFNVNKGAMAAYSSRYTSIRTYALLKMIYVWDILVVGCQGVLRCSRTNIRF